MTVNVSWRQFASDGLQDTVAQALAAAGLEGSALELQITESMLRNSLVRTNAILASLRAMDVRIAIDDFGTGYSSPELPVALPVQTVQIDRSFVARIDSGKGAALLTGAIVSMAHSLGLGVAAEGVGAFKQEQHLVKLGCELLQGYRFSRPVALEQLPSVMAFLAVQRRSSPDLHAAHAATWKLRLR